VATLIPILRSSCRRLVAGNVGEWSVSTSGVPYPSGRWSGEPASEALFVPPAVRRRPLAKTLVVGALIAYSPLLLLLLATVVLWTGTLATDRVAATMFGGGTLVFGALAAFAYLFAAQVALIYVDRRDDPRAFSVWGAVGSALLLGFAVLLPILLVGGGLLVLALTGAMVDTGAR
jgi:hypothetical protein